MREQWWQGRDSSTTGAMMDGHLYQRAVYLESGRKVMKCFAAKALAYLYILLRNRLF